MSYFAAAVARGPKGWTASQLDLTGVADIDEVAERLREVHADAEVSLLFVESDDQYLAILRLDDGEDLRVFGSDAVFAEESRLGALLLGDIGEPALELDTVIVDADAEEAVADDDDDVAVSPAAIAGDIEPIGDPDLLVDLGIPAQQLLKLCAHDGMLPADVTAELCQTIGCADAVEELREA